MRTLRDFEGLHGQLFWKMLLLPSFSHLASIKNEITLFLKQLNLSNCQSAFGQTSEDYFSDGWKTAISKTNFATIAIRKFANSQNFATCINTLENSSRDLSDSHSFEPLRPQKFSKFSSQILVTFSWISSKITEILQFSRRFLLKMHQILSEFHRFLPNTEKNPKIIGFFNFRC